MSQLEISQFNSILKPNRDQQLMSWWNSRGSPESKEDRPELIQDNALATFWTQLTPGTTYWRCTLPAKHLPGNVLHLKWEDLIEQEDGRVVLPRQVGASIWQFVGNGARALLMAHLQSQGIKAIMEVDDNYTAPVPHIPGRNVQWQVKLDRSPSDNYSIQAHRLIIKWVDAVICATPYLANVYESKTKAPIYVCPNSVDLDDWPEPRKKDDGIRRIGYAGSDSHRYDLTLIDRALDHASREPGIEVWKIGNRTAQWRWEHKQMEWSDDLAGYRRNLAVLDVGLCPLKRSVWHDCKSDIKAMEYLLAGAVPIVQRDSPCYSDWVDIVPSATTEKDWRKVVKWACFAPRDELKEVYDRGMKYLMENKLIQHHIHKWHEAIA